MRWPGAITVAKGGKFTTIYIGYGLKQGVSSYNPIEPPSVNQDPDEDDEKEEPNPRTEPPQADEVNTDNDEDKDDE